MNKKGVAPAFGLMVLLLASPAFATDDDARTLAAKSGETIDVRAVYGASKCKSILTAPPEIEVLQAPSEVQLSVREDMVKARNCPEKIKGGVVVAKVGEVKQPTDGKIVFRVKYKTKEGPRQIGYEYKISLVP